MATFLYDGDCAFCSSCARFVERCMRTDVDVRAWQFTDYAALGLTIEECDSAVQWVDPAAGPALPASLWRTDARRSAGPAAIARLLRSTRGPGALVWRPVGWLLSVPPFLRVTWPLYEWVSRNRDKLPGGTPACVLPQAQRATTGD